jgi:hypothetical protein
MSCVVPRKSLVPVPVSASGYFCVDHRRVLELHLARIKSLSLSVKEAQSYKTLLGVESVAKIVRYCPALTHIDMSACYGNDADDDFLFAVAESCPHLESIDLTCGGFSEKGILAPGAFH